jgi:hypothetical protein
MAVITRGSNRLLLELSDRHGAPGFEAVAAPGWVAAPAGAGASEHPWDQAHRAVREPTAVGFESAGPIYAEPDFVQAFPFPP